jgi:alpha/beta superfamily hydrolase
MRLQAEQLLIDGPVGKIDLIVENPGAPRGIALIAHPHPLFGGGNTNKVVQTLARTFTHLDYVALRPNFRGVGRSEGQHADGQGETEDLLAVLAEAKCRYGNLPVALAGFSFGAYVLTRVAEALLDAGHPAQRLVLVGTASGFVEGARRYHTKAVPTRHHCHPWIRRRHRAAGQCPRMGQATGLAGGRRPRRRPLLPPAAACDPRDRQPCVAPLTARAAVEAP